MTGRARGKLELVDRTQRRGGGLERTAPSGLEPTRLSLPTRPKVAFHQIPLHMPLGITEQKRRERIDEGADARCYREEMYY